MPSLAAGPEHVVVVGPRVLRVVEVVRPRRVRGRTVPRGYFVRVSSGGNGARHPTKFSLRWFRYGTRRWFGPSGDIEPKPVVWWPYRIGPAVGAKPHPPSSGGCPASATSPRLACGNGARPFAEVGVAPRPHGVLREAARVPEVLGGVAVERWGCRPCGPPRTTTPPARRRRTWRDGGSARVLPLARPSPGAPGGGARAARRRARAERSSRARVHHVLLLDGGLLWWMSRGEGHARPEGGR